MPETRYQKALKNFIEAKEALDKFKSNPKTKETSINLNCTFCGIEESKVSTLIAGPGVYICNECVEICNDLINEK